MDGISDRGKIFVIGATNRVDIIDPALMRPGRLGKLIYVSLPDANGRCEILEAHCKDRPINKDIKLSEIANNPKCDRFTGADLHSLVERACLESLKQHVKLTNEKNDNTGIDREEIGIDEMKNWFVKKEHFDMALKTIRPSVTQEQALMYDTMAKVVKSGQFVK